MVRLDFPTTNNEAKYEAVVAGLDLAKAAGVKKRNHLLRLSDRDQSCERRLRMQGGKDEEIS